MGQNIFLVKADSNWRTVAEGSVYFCWRLLNSLLQDLKAKVLCRITKYFMKLTLNLYFEKNIEMKNRFFFENIFNHFLQDLTNPRDHIFYPNFEN
jgi:hypothetical protein